MDWYTRAQLYEYDSDFHWSRGTLLEEFLLVGMYTVDHEQPYSCIILKKLLVKLDNFTQEHKYNYFPVYLGCSVALEDFNGVEVGFLPIRQTNNFLIKCFVKHLPTFNKLFTSLSTTVRSVPSRQAQNPTYYPHENAY